MSNNIASCFLMGGLGNLLFQIAALYSYSYKYNKKPVLYSDLYEVPAHGHMRQYFDNILKNIRIEPLCTLNRYNVNIYNETEFHYIPIPEFHGDVVIKGYFQSEKYFIQYRDQILDLFNINNSIEKKTCAIHIRRGDYLKLSHHHPVQPISYYSDAISRIGYDHKYIVFSDDIEWCRNNFENNLNLKQSLNIEYVVGQSSYQDLLDMSRCQHHIIANSSFSWWASWLNKGQDHITVCPNPDRWFGPAYRNKNTQDIPCQNWIVI